MRGFVLLVAWEGAARYQLSAHIQLEVTGEGRYYGREQEGAEHLYLGGWRPQIAHGGMVDYVDGEIEGQ
jgi:hypothetical protein